MQSPEEFGIENSSCGGRSRFPGTAPVLALRGRLKVPGSNRGEYSVRGAVSAVIGVSQWERRSIRVRSTWPEGATA